MGGDYPHDLSLNAIQKVLLNLPRSSELCPTAPAPSILLALLPPLPDHLPSLTAVGPSSSHLVLSNLLLA